MGNIWDIKARYKAAMNSEIGGQRGLFAGGTNPSYDNTIDYVNISSTGDATDFGDLVVAKKDGGGCSSHTRAIWGGGSTSAPTIVKTMDAVNIMSAGNCADFGDLTADRRAISAASNNTRGIWAGGYDAPARIDVVDYATIASMGNAIDFGNLATAVSGPAMAASPTRAIMAGGYSHPGGEVNTIQYVEIATTGNTV
ncbi:MAG: hypothetical protein VX199_04245, partial [Chloroflexota bacterium]|nr:hypothetical protein [Chloroflexota bacterium]